MHGEGHLQLFNRNARRKSFFFARWDILILNSIVLSMMSYCRSSFGDVFAFVSEFVDCPSFFSSLFHSLAAVHKNAFFVQNL